MSQILRLRSLQHAIATALFIAAAHGVVFGCSYFPRVRHVGRDFTVRIVDHGAPVSSVKVQLAKGVDMKAVENLTSDKDGLVKFSSIRAGSYTLSTKPGYLNWIFLEVSQSSKAEPPIEVEWPNLPRFEVSSLSGQLRTGLYPEVNHKSDPISDARLRLIDPISQREIAETRTDSSGSFHFEHLRDGIYFLHLGGREGTNPWDGDIYVSLKNNSSRRKNLGILYMAMTSCGLMASKERYK